jgi:hypothetical protein
VYSRGVRISAAALGFLVPLAACTGDPPVFAVADASSGEAGPRCAARSGIFSSLYTEKVGTCGPFANVSGESSLVESYTQQPAQPPPPCSGALGYSANDCTETVDTSCPVDGGAGTYTTRGTLGWSTDGTQASGDLDVSTPTCKSTYHVEVRRQ